MRALLEQVRRAPRTRALVRERPRPGRSTPWGVYAKWRGVHWALAHLADLAYPPEDDEIRPQMARALGVWLGPSYYREWTPGSNDAAPPRNGCVLRLQGRYRRCASQQGNALLYATRLGPLSDDCARLAERLIHWQWPDGGWNCDRNPSADTSSFMETLTPMAGLWAYGSTAGAAAARDAARRASEVFLRRRLYRRFSDGKVMNWEFPLLHYPLYYHYDILGGLKTLGTMGLLSDPRCADALDLLESKELPAGGWRADRRLYDLPGERPRRGTDRVLWGDAGPAMNPWVTVDALTVLRQAGRFEPAI
jgi:hypothetical protein